MNKQKKVDWKDTNMELFGSDVDRQVKKTAAQTEKAWKKCVECSEPGLFIWRIEQFKVVEWPKEMYGKFYSGDSYIVLNIYREGDSPELLYDIHFWIGQHSTQDEYCTAAYKTVELDTLMDDKPVQHREVENHESDLFKSYFSTIVYMKGGCPTGFRHVETKETTAFHLFHFCGERSKIVVKEVKPSKHSLDSGDVFILDRGNIAYQWNGSESNKNERFEAQQYLRQLSSDRFGKTKTEVIDEANTDASHDFFKFLNDEQSKKSYKHTVADTRHEKLLYKLSDQSGKMDFSKIAEGQITKDQITEEDVFIIDNGETVFVYVGQGASDAEKMNAILYAHDYLKQTSHPMLSVTVLNKNTKGINQKKFNEAVAAT